MKTIELNKEYYLDLGSLAPVLVKPIEFNDNDVLCEFLNSYSGKKMNIEYELFEMNEFKR